MGELVEVERSLFQISNRAKPQSAQRAQRRLVRHFSALNFSALLFSFVRFRVVRVFRGSSGPFVTFLSAIYLSISFRRHAFVCTASFVVIIALQAGAVRGMTGRRFSLHSG